MKKTPRAESTLMSPDSGAELRAGIVATMWGDWLLTSVQAASAAEFASGESMDCYTRYMCLMFSLPLVSPFLKWPETRVVQGTLRGSLSLEADFGVSSQRAPDTDELLSMFLANPGT